MDTTGRLRLLTRPGGDNIVIEIGVDGHGIPPEIQSRVFEPFFTTKDVGDGSGLGLDIVYRIVVTQHYGDITVCAAIPPGAARPPDRRASAPHGREWPPPPRFPPYP
jgi:signal transduction histidine kinase